MIRFRNKVFLVALGSLLSSSFVLSGLSIYTTKRSLEREIDLRSVVLTRTFFNIASENLAKRHIQPIGDFLDSLLADPDVAEARLLDLHGKSILSKLREDARSRSFNANTEDFKKALGQFTPVSRVMMEGRQHYKTVYQLVWSQGNIMTPLGMCYLKFSYDRLQSQIRHVAFICVMAIGIFMLMTLVGAYIFAAKITDPIERLKAATEAVREGRLSVNVPVTSKDELGELAETFNQMSENLRTTTISKYYLDGVIRGITDMLIVTDLRGFIRTVNRALLQRLGYTQEALLDQSVLVLLESQLWEKDENDVDARHSTKELPARPKLTSLNRQKPEDGAMGKEGVMQILKGIALHLPPAEFAKDLELNLLAKNGEKVPVLLSGSVLYDRKETADGLVVVAKDISERKKMESILLQSEKLSAVGQLAAGIAHEINNPLGIILGFAQSAAKRVQDSDALSLPLRSIEREAIRAKNLVVSLLTFSRRGENTLEHFDFNQMIDDTLAIVEAQARMRLVTISKDLQALEPLLGSKTQLQQVVVNLCSNAIDAMSEGGKLTVRTKQLPSAEGREAILEVEDTGTGIPEEIRQKIFDPFFTTKDPGKGTGLGLSLVHQIVLKHNGRIEMKSEMGKGTIFIVSIPSPGPA